MRTYTIQQLQHLRDVRLKGFVQNEMCDDHYTNEYYEFMHNTDKFLHWLTKMEGYALTSGHDIDLYSKLADPIPLTEDILLKCGAKLEDSEWQIKYADTAFIFEGSLGRGFYYTGGEGCKLSVLFYNLHELQNIFFALTGEELNIEL